MEITDKIKAKVFAQYLGQQVETKHNFEDKGIVSPALLDLILEGALTLEGWWEGAKLILKPLTEITDEEAVEMARLFNGIEGPIKINRPTDINNPDIHFVVQVYNEKPFKDWCFPKTWSDARGVMFYQYLQSKGYDLPNYYLGEKTLLEAGLAIYKD